MAVSDSKGGIVNLEGLDLKKLSEFKHQTGSLKGFENTKEISNEDLLELPVAVLVPAALENQIHKDNANKIQAKLIIEMANGPTAPEADSILHGKGIWVIPDVLSNSGGVATSYLEWVQNLADEHWPKAQVLEKLTKYMAQAWSSVLKTREEYKTDFRTAAFILAIRRIAEAMKNK